MDLRVRAGMRPREEDVTSLVIDTMLAMEPRRVATRTFSRAEEAKSGADWEWWIKGVHGLWLGLSIQAKISDKPKHPVVKIHHRAKTRVADQVTSLIDWARTHHSNPVYFIYGYFDPIKFAGVDTNCGSKIKMPNRAEAAILAVHALHVQRHYNKRKIPLRYNLAHMLPVRCLFCCAAVPGPIQDRIRGLLSEQLGPAAITTENPPDYVRIVDDSLYGDTRDDVELSADGFDIPPPKYVTVIRDSE